MSKIKAINDRHSDLRHPVNTTPGQFAPEAARAADGVVFERMIYP
ncbi:MAG: hypothetical protein P4N60_03640 [Verrucomicrobiae bacterium]|nr:hypothetical protein [Verrucomicrobiae bacterium]